jgi:hypothetical protein
MGWFKKQKTKADQRPSPEDLTPQFSFLAERARNHLEALTQAHMGTWRLGREENWDLDQDEGILRFSFADGMLAEAPAQIIGTFNERDSSWLWSWANSSIDEALQVDAAKVREFGQSQGFALLAQPTWVTEVEWAHTVTAIAVMHCEAQGAYFPDLGGTILCLTFGNVKLSRVA